MDWKKGGGRPRVCLQKISPSAAALPSGLEEEEEEFWDEDRTVQSQAG